MESDLLLVFLRGVAVKKQCDRDTGKNLSVNNLGSLTAFGKDYIKMEDVRVKPKHLDHLLVVGYTFGHKALLII